MSDVVGRGWQEVKTGVNLEGQDKTGNKQVLFTLRVLNGRAHHHAETHNRIDCFPCSQSSWSQKQQREGNDPQRITFIKSSDLKQSSTLHKSYVYISERYPFCRWTEGGSEKLNDVAQLAGILNWFLKLYCPQSNALLAILLTSWWFLNTTALQNVHQFTAQREKRVQSVFRKLNALTIYIQKLYPFQCFTFKYSFIKGYFYMKIPPKS